MIICVEILVGYPKKLLQLIPEFSKLAKNNNIQKAIVFLNTNKEQSEIIKKQCHFKKRQKYEILSISLRKYITRIH